MTRVKGKFRMHKDNGAAQNSSRAQAKAAGFKRRATRIPTLADAFLAARVKIEQAQTPLVKTLLAGLARARYRDDRGLRAIGERDSAAPAGTCAPRTPTTHSCTGLPPCSSAPPTDSPQPATKGNTHMTEATTIDHGVADAEASGIAQPADSLAAHCAAAFGEALRPSREGGSSGVPATPASTVPAFLRDAYPNRG
jgi:hypothetical protein